MRLPRAMRKTAALPTLGSLLLLAATLHQGCSQQRNPLPSSGSASTAAGATAAGPTAPVGPFPRGTSVDPSRLPDPALEGPLLSVLAPEPGAQVTGADIEVRVQAADQDGVADVTVAGVAAAPAGGGVFVARVPLAPGPQVLAVRAADALGNARTGHVAVVQGRFEAAPAFVEGGLGVALTQAGLDRVTDLAAQHTRTLDVFALIARHNPIVHTSVLEVTALSLAHDPLRFRAEGAPAGLTLTVFLDRPRLEVQADVIGVAHPRATLLADRATAVVQATVDRNAPVAPGQAAKRTLGLRIDRIDVTLDRFDAVAASSALTTLLSPFRSTLERTVQRELEEVLRDAADKLFAASLAGIDRPLVVSLPAPAPPSGSRADLEALFRVDGATGSAQTGLGVLGAARLAAQTPASSLPARGVLLSTTLPGPPAPGPEAFAASLTDGAINALAQALWSTGALRAVLDGTQPATGSMRLRAGLLHPFLPPVADLAPDPDTPLVVEAELGAPPVVRFDRLSATPVEVAAPDVVVRLSIDYMDGGPRLELATLRASVTVAGDVALDASHLRVSGLQLVAAHVDVVAEPAADLDDQAVEDFVRQVAPWLVDRLRPVLPALPIPALPLGLTLSRARLELGTGTLTVRGDL